MRYAIFDFDGTIVDSMSYWRNFSKAYLEEHGYEPKESLDTINQVNWIQAVCDYYVEHYGLKVTPQEFYRWGLEHMGKKYKNDIDFKPGAKEVLDRMKAEGIKMCICTSTDKYLMWPCLVRLGLEDYFEFSVHCRETGIEKNEPETFLNCMRRLGAENPGEVGVFEDSYYALSTAADRGFYTVGIYDVEEAKRQELIKEKASQYIKDWSEFSFEKLPD